MCPVEKQGNIYILTLTGTDQHRLNPTLISSIRSSLSSIKSQFIESNSQPSALITTAQGKFFSNGYDISYANSTTNRERTLSIIDTSLQGLVHELICFPMPTIVAVTGHASAAGMILALAHDYVIMRRDKGYLYMSELDIGLVIPQWFIALLKCKIADSRLRRKVVLAAAKVTGEMGKEIGVVDDVGEGVEETVDKAVDLAGELVKRGWDGWIYGKNRMRLFKEFLDLIVVDKGLDLGEEQDVGNVSRSRL